MKVMFLSCWGPNCLLYKLRRDGILSQESISQFDTFNLFDCNYFIRYFTKLYDIKFVRLLFEERSIFHDFGIYEMNESLIRCLS